MAEERGVYATYEGSLWSKGILPIDSIELVAAKSRGKYLEQDTSPNVRLGNTYENALKQWVCVIQMYWRLHPQQPFPIFAV